MNMNRTLATIVALLALSAPVAAAQVTVTETVTVTKPAPTLTVTFVPPNPTILCTLAPGAVVSAVKTVWSDGSTTVPTLAMPVGGPEFALVGTNVVVNSTGTALANLCASIPAGGTPKTVTVTAN